MNTKKTGSKPAIAYVGVVAPEDLCDCSLACSVAGNKFQLNVIRELERINPKPLYVIGVKPLAMYPRERHILVGSDSCIIGEKTKSHMISFINLPVIKQVTIALAIFWRLLAWLWQNRSESCVVLVYTMFSPLSLPVLAATRLLGGKPVVIVAELPFAYNFQGAKGILERLDFLGQTRAIAHFVGLIALTHQIAQDFAPGRPMLVVEGGVETGEVGKLDARNASLATESPIDKKIILYSGALNDISGVDLLIQAFQLLPDPQYRLHIFGRGPMESLVREAVAQDKRIFYGGVLPNPEIKRRQAQATVLVNPRPSHRKITYYTFPSKLLEYLVSGRPTITTALPGIPDEYYPYVYLLRDETPEGLAQLIQDVCSKDPAELEQLGQRAREFVLLNKNWTRQGERIYEFICNL